MSLRASTRLLYLLPTMTVCTILLHANELIGSMPLAGAPVTENGPNLLAATAVMGTNSLTSGAGSDDFSIVAMKTSLGPFSLTDTTVSTDGGFSISNAGYGSFVPTGGSITAETTNAPVVDMTGTYAPGPLFDGLTAVPVEAALVFTQNGTSISASFALVTTGTPIPPPVTMVIMGIGLCCAALLLRRKLRHE